MYKVTTVKIGDYETPVYSFAVCVVGSGAASLNCADTLVKYAVGDVALITEGMNMGTSRNTGSDKQTYYKLNLSGGSSDSIYELAHTLWAGGSMHGDLALVEAALSAQAFFKLVNLGVPFPHNEYGEYTGYMTDHDTRSRATSCGPLTSKYMTEALERAVLENNTPIFDGYRVIQILTDNGKAVGIVTLSEKEVNATNLAGLSIFLCDNLVWGTGGPSGIYSATVYPESQTCAHGAAFLAGAEGVNLTESQYGLASIKFRWNLSGTYQQVIPRYFSTNADGGDEKEFLRGVFIDDAALHSAEFLKGYQWPFDPRKLDGGSSEIDIAVYNERRAGRRVFIDYTRNPFAFDFNKLSEEAYKYLENSGALFGTPFERLKKMNNPAIELYLSNGIDLSCEPLEIDVCAQHNNGGLSSDIWYESTSLSNFFPIGEANGVFGVYRPGGSALNSTQVSSLRAAARIRRYLNNAKSDSGNNLKDSAKLSILNNIKHKIPLLSIFGKEQGLTFDDIIARRAGYGARMSKCGAFIRKYSEVRTALSECESDLEVFLDINTTSSPRLFKELTINYDILITQKLYLSAIKHYIEQGGESRGSYLIMGNHTNENASIDDKKTALQKDCLLYASLVNDKVIFRSEQARPVPVSEQWFENVYNSFIKGEY